MQQPLPLGLCIGLGLGLDVADRIVVNGNWRITSAERPSLVGADVESALRIAAVDGQARCLKGPTPGGGDQPLGGGACRRAFRDTSRHAEPRPRRHESRGHDYDARRTYESQTAWTHTPMKHQTIFGLLAGSVEHTCRPIEPVSAVPEGRLVSAHCVGGGRTRVMAAPGLASTRRSGEVV